MFARILNTEGDDHDDDHQGDHDDCDEGEQGDDQDQEQGDDCETTTACDEDNLGTEKQMH